MAEQIREKVNWSRSRLLNLGRLTNHIIDLTYKHYRLKSSMLNGNALSICMFTLMKEEREGRSSLVPRPSYPVFDCFQYVKTGDDQKWTGRWFEAGFNAV